MRNGQNKRMRGRNRKNHNPLTRVYESNGPDVKIRGTANHVAEKYIQLARDAQASGDPVGAENYYQHAEHYFRLIAAAQEQFRQSPSFYRPEGGEQPPRGADDAFDESDDDMQPSRMGGTEPHYPREMRDQPSYPPRDQQQSYPVRDHQQHHQPQHQPRPQQQRQRHDSRPQQSADAENGDIDRLPSFITGSQPQHQGQSSQDYGQNGHDNQPDRFPLHRRRRRPRGPRPDMPDGAPQVMDASEAADDTPPSTPSSE